MAEISVNEKTYEIDEESEKLSIKNNGVYVDDKLLTEDQELKGIVKVVIHGTTLLDVQCDQTLEVHGRVSGHVNANGAVACGCVRGDVNAKGSVNSHEVYGDVYAHGGVSCFGVEGNVYAESKVNVIKEKGSL